MVSALILGGTHAAPLPHLVTEAPSLDDIAAEIRGDNANMWRSSWDPEARGRLGKPGIETDSLNATLPWIRDRLRSRGITVEPEAADQKRVDIRLTRDGVGTLPIEIKRTDNRVAYSLVSKTRRYGTAGLLAWSLKALCL